MVQPRHVAEEQERRWIVLKMDPSILGNIQPNYIEQAFMQPSPMYCRTRQSRKEAYFTGPHIDSTGDTKRGWGKDRVEETWRLDQDTARFNFVCCGNRRILKRRYQLNKHDTIDFYDDALAPLGLVKFEREGSDDMTLPPEIENAALVTNNFCDQQLAELNEEMASGLWDVTQAMDILQGLINPPPLYVITGGPCSGKSSTIEFLQSHLNSKAHFMPEIARQVIDHFNCPVPWQVPLNMKMFERHVVALQHHHYKLALQRMRLDNKQIIISDRWIDPWAYLGPLEVEEKMQILQTELDYELARVQKVFLLEIPDQETYEECLANDQARTEEYRDALMIQEWIRDTYKSHPNLVVVPPVSPDQMHLKFNQVLKAINL